MTNTKVENLLSPVRLSEYAHIAFPELITKSMGKKSVKKGEVFLNGKVGNTFDWVENGMNLTLEQTRKSLNSKNSRILQIVWEDEHLAVIVKPAGINVSGNRSSILDSLNNNVSQSEEPDKLHCYLNYLKLTTYSLIH